MKPDLKVVKVGGKVIGQEKMLHEFLSAFRGLGVPKILVHGGGSIATEIASKLGYESQLIDGRRVTNDDMIGVVTMTYGGLLNKRIVSHLQGLGENALGLTGADGNLIRSRRRPVVNNIDYGWVGDPESVNSDLVHALIRNGSVPVIAPLTHDGSGHMLNTNADTIANQVATSMTGFYNVHLAYAFELNGVMKDIQRENSLIRELDESTYNLLKKNGVISTGMIPKLDNAFQAIKKGVKTVTIVNYKSIGRLDDEEYHDYTRISQ